HYVPSDPSAYKLFYKRFCNETLWFIQHGLPWPDGLSAAGRAEAWADGYLKVNEAFAAAAIEQIDSGEIRAVMFHDYHFYLAPRLVREAHPEAFLQHFIHIPWPAPAEWQRLEMPMLESICDGLLGNDSIVFQTSESAANFLRTCAEVLPSVAIDVHAGTVRTAGRTVRVWANGISVDPDELTAASA